LGILTGFAITQPNRRALFSTAVAAILIFGVWASTIGRPVVNLSSNGGYEEGRMGYEALIANRNQEAVRWFRDAVTYRRGTSVYWFDLGVAYERVNDKAAALTAFRKAADLGEPNAQFFIGAAYDNGGQGLPKDTNQALYWYGKAAVQNNAAAQNNLAWAYATSSDPAIRNPVAALELAQKAVNSEQDHPDPSHLDTLAEAYYVNQKYEEAVETEQQAIALMSAAPAPEEDVSAFQKSLEKYQQAFRDSKIHLKTQ
jgi:TPR repeat protein